MSQSLHLLNLFTYTWVSLLTSSHESHGQVTSSCQSQCPHLTWITISPLQESISLPPQMSQSLHLLMWVAVFSCLHMSQSPQVLTWDRSYLHVSMTVSSFSHMNYSLTSTWLNIFTSSDESQPPHLLTWASLLTSTCSSPPHSCSIWVAGTLCFAWWSAAYRPIRSLWAYTHKVSEGLGGFLRSSVAYAALLSVALLLCSPPACGEPCIAEVATTSDKGPLWTKVLWSLCSKGHVHCTSSAGSVREWGAETLIPTTQASYQLCVLLSCVWCCRSEECPQGCGVTGSPAKEITRFLWVFQCWDPPGHHCHSVWAPLRLLPGHSECSRHGGHCPVLSICVRRAWHLQTSITVI